MPEYDLGTAHGRIKIDVDDRGAQQAERSVDKLERTMQSLDRRMAAMQTSMVSIENEIRKLNNEFKKANDEAENLESSINDLGKGFEHGSLTSKVFSSDIQIATRRMLAMAQAAKTIIPPLTMLRRFMNNFGNSRGGTFGFIDAFVKSGAAATGISLLTSRLLGLHRVMQNAPAWRMNLLRFGGAIQAVIGGFGFINWLSRGRLNAALFGRTVGLVATKIGDLGDKILQLGLRFGTSFKVIEKAGAIAGKMDSLAKGIVKVFDVTSEMGQAFQSLAKGSINTAMGIGLMKVGLTGLAERFQKLGWAGKLVLASLAGIATVGPASLEVLGKALVGTSNLLLGLLDGIKQLSGGFLALPGAISMGLAAASTLSAAFVGLKDQFKDIFSDDPIKAAIAFVKLPPHLQSIGKALVDLKPKLKDVQVIIQKELFSGLENQIRSLTSNYIPVLQHGMVTVAHSMRMAKDQFVAFLLEGQTKADTSAVYDATAQAINNIAKAVKPAAEALRDITVIGAQFIAELSGGLPRVTQKLAEWASVNRQNGNLMKWMKEAWQGVKDLTSGVIDATKATWKLLTMFASNNGDNFLSRFASAMERFNNAVQKSAASGNIKKIGDYVRNMGTESIKKFSDVMRSVFDAVDAAAPVIKTIAESASKILVPAFKAAAQIVETFFDILNATHLGPVIGIFAGIIGAILGLVKVLAPLKGIIQTVAGAFMLFKGAGELINGATYFLSLMGPAGAKAATGIAKLTAAFKGLMAAAAIVTIVWTAFSQHSQYIKDASQVIDDSLAKNKQSYQDLLNVFNKSNGNNKDALSGVVENTKNKFKELQDVADQAPSMWRHIMAGLGGQGVSGANEPQSIFEKLFNTNLGQSDEFNQIQKTTDAAKRAIEGFKQVGASADFVSKVVAEGGPAYEKLYADLTKAGEATGKYGEDARAAAAKLKEWRDQVAQAAKDAAALGEGGFKVIDGIKQIGDAAGDSSQKLNGLKSILEGLGLVKTSAMEAAAQYAQGLIDLSNAATSIIAPGENLNGIIDAQTGKLDLNKQSAINLSNTLTSLAQQYQNAITNGTDAGKAYGDFATRIDELTDKLNNAAGGIVITKDQMRALAQEAGTFDPKNLQQKLNQFINDPQRKKILLEANINEDSLKKVQQQITGAFNGVSMVEQNGLHGGYADRARAQEKAAQDKATQDFKTYAENVTKIFNESADKAGDAGRKFAQAFADGLSSNDAAIQAAEIMAEEVMKRFHRSPPQKGPLAAHGDAARYGGGMFVRSYATGIKGNLGYVQNAADQMAGTVADGTGTTSMGFGQKAGSNAGKFLGQILDLVDVASKITGIFQKVSQNIFQALKFISDPKGEGTFFGKKRYQKTVAESDLQKAIKDQIQSNGLSALQSAQRDTSNFDPATGKMKAPPVNMAMGNIPKDASASEVQNKIIAEGQKRGLTPAQIQAALAIAKIESNYGQNNYGGQQGPTVADQVWGVFQQKASWGTLDQRQDPNYNINAFMDAYQQKLAGGMDPLIAGVLTQNPQLGTGALGSTYYDTVRQALPTAIQDYANTIKNPPNISPSDMGLQILRGPNVASPGDTVTYTPKWMMDNGFAPLYTRDANGNAQVPKWATDLAKAFNLTANTYFDPNGGLHGMGQGGWAFDFNSPTGNTADLERFAQFLEQNMAGNLAQLIFSGTRDYGIAGGVNVGGPKGQARYYGYGDQGYPGHGDHVHGAFFMPPGGVYPSTAQMPGTQIPPFLQSYNGGDTNQTIVQQNPQTGAWEIVDPHGEKAGSPPGSTYIDALGQVQQYTDQQIKDLQNQMPNQYTLPTGMSMDQFQQFLTSPEYTRLNQEDILKQVATTNSDVANALKLRDNPDLRNAYTSDQMSQLLQGLDNLIKASKTADTAAGRMQGQALEGLQSSVMQVTGFSQVGNPIDTVATIVSQATSMASDVINAVVTGIETVGSVEAITATLARGVSSTEDIYKNVDNVQKIFELFAGISGAVSSITGLAGTIVGAAGSGDSSGGTQAAAMVLNAIGMVAGFIQAGWEITNAVIDLGQEVYRIAGQYVGDFLGYLVGGTGGPLQGNIKFLLDQQANQLLTYAAENPMDKRTFDIPRTNQNPNARNQLVGNINVYGGPGSDPRDLTRQMMFQVNSAQYAGALAQ